MIENHRHNANVVVGAPEIKTMKSSNPSGRANMSQELNPNASTHLGDNSMEEEEKEAGKRWGGGNNSENKAGYMAGESRTVGQGP